MWNPNSIWTAVIWLFTSATVFAAGQVNPIEGTLTVGDHTYKLAHAVAYETTSGGEPVIAIIASDRKLPIEKLVAALAAGKDADDGLWLSQPHVIVTYKPAGEPQRIKGFGDGGSFVMGGSTVKGDIKIADGRVRGQSTLPTKRQDNFQSGYDFHIDVPLGLQASAEPMATKAAPVKPFVTGTFKGNGKAAKLAYVSARAGDPFGGEPSIVLVFTERDHSKAARPDIKASFGEFGSALVISSHYDGKIFGCEVAHSAHSKKPFSSLGNVRTAAFDAENGRVEGQIVTEGEINTFDQTWELDIKFAAPFTAPAASASAATSSPPAADAPAPPKQARRQGTPNAKPKGSEPPSANEEKLKVRDLALPKNSSDFEYKTLVEHMSFKSPSGVQALAGQLAKSLASQGWKGDGSDLVTPKSAILKRKRGAAELTVFVKPDGGGSKVTIMSEGLDWSE